MINYNHKNEIPKIVKRNAQKFQAVFCESKYIK